ncbi:MAG: DUF4304 domain-containing protein [Clostridia bacterium]|nr:DUF4304 domain-containing protein [Clostridia bacterium]
MFTLLKSRFSKKEELTNTLSSTESVDIIENTAYEYLKPLGFKKHGRTLHRFVDGDMSQVLWFQNGCPQKGVTDIFWLSIGIRIPECNERKFVIDTPMKKYYREYECDIRTDLGSYVNGSGVGYDLKKDPYRIAEDVLKKIKENIMPVFDLMSSRDGVLKYRREYKSFDLFHNRAVLLHEAMIYGRRGDIEKAYECFNEYYKNALDEYTYTVEHGSQFYLKKGKSVMYLNRRTGESETIVAKKDGYVTLYDANDAHLKALEELALKLDIPLLYHR